MAFVLGLLPDILGPISSFFSLFLFFFIFIFFSVAGVVCGGLIPALYWLGWLQRTYHKAVLRGQMMWTFFEAWMYMSVIRKSHHQIAAFYSDPIGFLASAYSTPPPPFYSSSTSSPPPTHLLQSFWSTSTWSCCVTARAFTWLNERPPVDYAHLLSSLL